jgi:hypothetical protein
MKEKECMICKKEFIDITKNQKFCSNECRMISLKNATQRAHNKFYKTNKRKEYMKEYRKKYYGSDKIKQTMKKYYETHKDQMREQAKKYQEANKEKVLARIKAYRRTSLVSKQSRKMQKIRRREAKHNSIIAYTLQEWKQKCEATNGICPCCYTVFNNGLYKLSLDHTPSLAEAQKRYKLTGVKQIYTINEVTPLCLRCNIKKNDKDISIEELRKIVLGKSASEVEEVKPKHLNTPVTLEW